MGIPFSDFVTALDEMGQRGLTASQAALSLKNVLIGLSDPTTKAQKELADLGVISVNDAAPGLGALVYQVNQFNKVPLQLDGTLTNLNQLYTDAVKVGALHTDQSFYQWASSIGAISNNLYDAQGHFKNFDQIVNILSGDLGNMQTPEAVSTALEQLFNRTALKGGQIIFDTGDSRQKLNELRQALQEYISGGGSAKDAATITQTASARMKELGSTVHSAAAQIGTSLLPIISNVAGGINNWANMMRTHHPELLKFIGIVLVLATVFTGIGTVVAGAILFFTAFATVIGAVAVPALLIAGAIAGLIVVVALVVTHFSQIKAVLAPIGDLFGTIAGFVGSVLGPVFGQLGQQWGKLASMVLPELKSAFGDIGSALGSMGTLLGSLTPVWDVLKVVLIAVGAVVGVVLAAAFSSIIGIINAVVHALAFIIMGVADVAKGLIGFVSGALSFFINGWKMMIQIVIALFTGHFNEIPKIITSLGPKLLTSLLTMVQGIGNVLKGAFFGLVGSLGAAAWGMFSGVLGTLGNIANTIFPGIGKNLVQGLLNGLLGGPKALGDWFKGLWDNLLNQIRKMLGIQSPSTVFSDMGNNIIQGLINGLNKLVGSVPTILKTLATNMLAAVADLPKQFADLAGHIIDGLANGIKNGAGKVASGLGHVKDGIISGFKSGFGIFSPSKVMAELGTFVSQGLIVGIQSVDVGKQANDHFAKVKPDANSLIHTPGYAAMHAQSTVAMHNASGYGQGDLTIPLVVDGKTMAQVTIDRWTGQLKSNGVGRKLR
jgi:phage-related protein